MAFNSQEQSIIKWGLDNGKSKDDVSNAIHKYRSGVQPTQGSSIETQNNPQQTPKPSYLNRVTDAVGTDINNRVERVGNILNRPDSSTLEKGVQTFGQGAGMAANALEKTVTEIPGVKPALNFVNEGIDWLATSNSSPLKHLGDVIGSNKAVQKMVDLYDTDQNFKDSVDAVANTVRLGGDIDSAVQGANFTKGVVDKMLNKTPTPVPPKTGSFEALSEENYGFKPGMRKVFDDALMKGDKTTVSKLLPDVPEAYKAGLAERIKSVVGDQSPVTKGISAESVANIGPKTISTPGSIVKDILPTRERFVNTELTKAFDLTPGDVKNISLSTGNEPGEFLSSNNLIGVNKEATLKKVNDFYRTNYDTVRSEIGKVKATYDPVEIPRYTEALKAIKQKIAETPGLQESNYEIDSLLKKTNPTLSDVQRVKELMDQHFNLYKATGDVGQGVAKEGLANIRKDIKEWIEEEVKDKTGADIKDLNNKVQTARSLSDAIEVRSTRGLTRSNLTTKDLVTFLAAGGAYGSPVTGALTVIAKKIYQSPTFKLRLSKWLDDLGDAKRLKIQQDLDKGILPPELKDIQSSNTESIPSKNQERNAPVQTTDLINKDRMPNSIPKLKVKVNMKSGKADILSSRKGPAPEDALKDFLIQELPKSGGTTRGLNLGAVNEAEEFVQFLQDIKNPTLADMHRGLELLKLQGKDVNPILDLINKPTTYKQFRDDLGRFSSKK